MSRLDPGYLLHTGPDVRVARPSDGVLEVRNDTTTVRLEQLHRTVAESICLVVSQGARQMELADAIRSKAGSNAVAEFLHCLHELSRARLLWRSVQEGELVLLTWQPGERNLSPTPFLSKEDVTYALSRFSFLRPGSDGFAVETAKDSGRVLVRDTRALLLVGELARAVSAADLVARCAGLSEATVRSVLHLLWDADLLIEGARENDPAGPCWEFHDLLFHTRSRLGRHHQPSGGTYRFLGESDGPPALLQPAAEAGLVELPGPNAGNAEADVLDDLLASRRSIRRYGPDAITVEELGAFLYRTARVTQVEQVSRETPRGLVRTDVARRPYPGGGGLYEFEVYVAVNRCRGLAPGLYQYHAGRHVLEACASGSESVARLVGLAAASAGMQCEDTQLLIVLAARFERIAWKYSSMAYATILKDAGVVLQTMYLVATAMRLAPCAIGCGDSEEFARVSANSYYEQGSVSEFLLGSL